MWTISIEANAGECKIVYGTRPRREQRAPPHGLSSVCVRNCETLLLNIDWPSAIIWRAAATVAKSIYDNVRLGQHHALRTRAVCVCVCVVRKAAYCLISNAFHKFRNHHSVATNCYKPIWHAAACDCLQLPTIFVRKVNANSPLLMDIDMRVFNVHSFHIFIYHQSHTFWICFCARIYQLNMHLRLRKHDNRKCTRRIELRCHFIWLELLQTHSFRTMIHRWDNISVGIDGSSVRQIDKID